MNRLIIRGFNRDIAKGKKLFVPGRDGDVLVSDGLRSQGRGHAVMAIGLEVHYPEFAVVRVGQLFVLLGWPQGMRRLPGPEDAGNSGY